MLSSQDLQSPESNALDAEGKLMRGRKGEKKKNHLKCLLLKLLCFACACVLNGKMF